MAPSWRSSTSVFCESSGRPSNSPLRTNDGILVAVAGDERRLDIGDPHLGEGEFGVFPDVAGGVGQQLAVPFNGL